MHVYWSSILLFNAHELQVLCVCVRVRARVYVYVLVREREREHSRVYVSGPAVPKERDSHSNQHHSLPLSGSVCLSVCLDGCMSRRVSSSPCRCV